MSWASSSTRVPDLFMPHCGSLRPLPLVPGLPVLLVFVAPTAMVSTALIGKLVGSPV